MAGHMATRRDRRHRGQQPDGAGGVGAPESVSTWHALMKHVEERRTERRISLPQVQSALIRRLQEVAHLRLCDPAVRGWFTTDKDKLTISSAAPAKVGDWPAIPLMDLEHI